MKNPLSVDEDFLVTEIRPRVPDTRCAAAKKRSYEHDVRYVQKKLFAALQIPRVYPRKRRPMSDFVVCYTNLTGSFNILLHEDDICVFANCPHRASPLSPDYITRTLECPQVVRFVDEGEAASGEIISWNKARVKMRRDGAEGIIAGSALRAREKSNV